MSDKDRITQLTTLNKQIREELQQMKFDSTGKIWELQQKIDDFQEYKIAGNALNKQLEDKNTRLQRKLNAIKEVASL